MPSEESISLMEYCCAYIVLLIVFRNLNKPAVAPHIELPDDDDSMNWGDDGSVRDEDSGSQNDLDGPQGLERNGF